MFKRNRLEFLPVFVAAFMILGLLSTGAWAKEAPDPSDDFNDNIIDLAKWYVPDFDPQFRSVAEVSQQLELSLTSANVGPNFNVYVFSIWRLGGDFDIQVDYRLLIWPPENKIRVGLGAEEGAVQRTGGMDPGDPNPLPDLYLTHFQDGIHGETETDVDEGSLRLVRADSRLSGYFSDETTDGWVLIHTGPPFFARRVSVVLSMWGHVSTPDILVAFDNFKVNSGQVYMPFDELIDFIKSMGLQRGIEKSLIAKLENGLEVFMKGQRHAGTNILNAFINEVKTQSGKEIPEPLANILIANIELILSRLEPVPNPAPARQRGLGPRGKLSTIWGKIKTTNSGPSN